MLKKRVGILRRRPDLPFADFNQHWATGHAKLVASLPGVQGYVQNPVVKTWPGTQNPDTVDGMIEVWFDGSTVATPNQHTSAAQREDELRFMAAFTAFTVTNLETYDAQTKVWVLLDPDTDATIDEVRGSIDQAALDLAVLRTANPEPGVALMDRPDLQRETAPPAGILILGCDEQDAEKVYDAVVDAVTASAPPTTRVLLTRSRRIV